MQKLSFVLSLKVLQWKCTKLLSFMAKQVHILDYMHSYRNNSYYPSISSNFDYSLDTEIAKNNNFKYNV